MFNMVVPLLYDSDVQMFISFTLLALISYAIYRKNHVVGIRRGIGIILTSMAIPGFFLVPIDTPVELLGRLTGIALGLLIWFIKPKRIKKK